MIAFVYLVLIEVFLLGILILLLLRLFSFAMSAEQEVTRLLSGSGDDLASKALLSLDLAKQEVIRMLSATGSSVLQLCTSIESARSKQEVKAAFTQFNLVIRIFLKAAPNAEHDSLVRDSLCSVGLSDRLELLLQSAASVPEALSQYKTLVVTDLAEVLRVEATLSHLDDERDDELLLRLLPQPSPPHVEEVKIMDDATQSVAAVNRPSRKRGFSDIGGLASIPKKSTIPALASITRMQELVDLGCASKKQALLTREKLRSGIHDPRGLLSMIGSSTNALERAKKLELLKSAGFGFDQNKKSPGKTSFADRCIMAMTRLELGLGGHALSDTLLFGAKVLSTPGALSPKNIVDIENNIVDGKTT